MRIEPGLLDSGEKLVWSGQPDATRYAGRTSTGTFLFGLLFLCFSVFWTVGAARSAGAGEPLGVPFWSFGLPFVAIGACMVLSPVWQFFRARHTSYVVTNRRAITSIAGPFPRRISVPLNQIRFVELRRADSAFGDVLFQDTVVSDGEGGRAAKRNGFVAVPNATRVEQVLRSAMEKAAAMSVRSP